eukprot:1147927-Pelagomonas_calceolata.AAC.10
MLWRQLVVAEFCKAVWFNKAEQPSQVCSSCCPAAVQQQGLISTVPSFKCKILQALKSTCPRAHAWPHPMKQ